MKMTEEQIMEAKEMRSEGISYAKIGVALGLCDRTIRYTLNPAARQHKAAYDKAHKAEAAAYRVRRREERKAYNAAYRAAHKEEGKAYRKIYNAEHSEEKKAYGRAYGAAYRERINAYSRVYNVTYHATHREEARAYSREYYATHREERCAYQRAYKGANPGLGAAYRKAHRAQFRASDAKRRALEAGALIGATVSQLAEIAEIYRKAQEERQVRCYLCGQLISKGHRHVDHIMPLSKGGAHRPLNLAVACDTCNLHKYAKLPYEVGVLI